MLIKMPLDLLRVLARRQMLIRRYLEAQQAKVLVIPRDNPPVAAAGRRHGPGWHVDFAQAAAAAGRWAPTGTSGDPRHLRSRAVLSGRYGYGCAGAVCGSGCSRAVGSGGTRKKDMGKCHGASARVETHAGRAGVRMSSHPGASSVCHRPPLHCSNVTRAHLQKNSLPDSGGSCCNPSPPEERAGMEKARGLVQGRAPGLVCTRPLSSERAGSRAGVRPRGRRANGLCDGGRRAGGGAGRREAGERVGGPCAGSTRTARPLAEGLRRATGGVERLHASKPRAAFT